MIFLLSFVSVVTAFAGAVFFLPVVFSSPRRKYGLALSCAVLLSLPGNAVLTNDMSLLPACCNRLRTTAKSGIFSWPALVLKNHSSATAKSTYLCKGLTCNK